jgi:hypothetical protein
MRWKQNQPDVNYCSRYNRQCHSSRSTSYNRDAVSLIVNVNLTITRTDNEMMSASYYIVFCALCVFVLKHVNGIVNEPYMVRFSLLAPSLY